MSEAGQTSRILNFENETASNQPTAEVPPDLIPKIGMEFESQEDAYNFYNEYARRVGFSIRYSVSHKKNGEVVDRLFRCVCTGERPPDKRNDNVKSRRAETRFDCLASMGISSRRTGKFCVYRFEADHTHSLVSPRKVHLLRSHRHMTNAQKAEVDMAESSGITPKATMELLARQVGGREHIGFIPNDYKNYLRSKRTINMKMGDTGGVLEYLQRKQSEDPHFSYAVQVDEDDLITNIFWSDSLMKLDYQNFGDVVCFDTTYKKNKDGRPFALFVGVNHHKQTVVFGAALLYDETAATFEWLFKTFESTMDGKMPKTILTDQDAAMSKAIASSWPETYHRLCVWHMYQNAARHLSHVFDQFKGFAKDFSSCVYDHDEVETFLIAWREMRERYNLQDNDWLKRIFDVKEKWALVYERQIFCADMSTTQRSESMNGQIKKYVDYKYDLLHFFHHFERLVEDRRYEELKADCKASQSMPALTFPVEILKHAATVYTPEVFKIFHKEIWETWNCNIDVFEEDLICMKYKISPFNGRQEHFVTFNSIDCKVSYSCKKFEFVGILCSHALKVLSLKNARRIPDDYVLKRWRKDAKSGSKVFIQHPTDPKNPKMSMAKRYKDLSILFSRLAAKAAEFEETSEIALHGYTKLVQEIDEEYIRLSTSNFEVGLEGENCLDTTRIALQPDTSNIPQVKGLKTKPKTTLDKSSKRRVGASEKATKNRKSKKAKPNERDFGTKDISSAPSQSNTVDLPDVHDQFQLSYTNSTQVSNVISPHSYSKSLSTCVETPFQSKYTNFSKASNAIHDPSFSQILDPPCAQDYFSYPGTNIGEPYSFCLGLLDSPSRNLRVRKNDYLPLGWNEQSQRMSFQDLLQSASYNYGGVKDDSLYEISQVQRDQDNTHEDNVSRRD